MFISKCQEIKADKYIFLGFRQLFKLTKVFDSFPHDLHSERTSTAVILSKVDVNVSSTVYFLLIFYRRARVYMHSCATIEKGTVSLPAFLTL